MQCNALKKLFDLFKNKLFQDKISYFKNQFPKIYIDLISRVFSFHSNVYLELYFLTNNTNITHTFSCCTVKYPHRRRKYLMCFHIR